MKKHRILFSLLVGFLVASCELFDKNPRSSFNALKDDTEWSATSSWTAYSVKDKKMGVVGQKRDANYFLDERLSLIFYTKDISAANTVENFYAQWNAIIGGDGITDTYVLDTTYNNTINIDLFDTEKKQISGTFEVKLVKPKSEYNLVEETMLYKNGTFKMNYEEKE